MSPMLQSWDYNMVFWAVLSKDIATVSGFLQTWKLKHNTTKTVSEVFHFTNKEVKQES